MNLDYKILHDADLPLVFVGRSYHNQTLYKYFEEIRTCFHMSLEQVLTMPDSWFRDHQFMCAMSNVAFKMQVANELEKRSAHFFSVMSLNSAIGHRVKIGHGTLINHFNVLYDDSIVADHTTVTNYVQISHEVTVESYCHVSPYTYLCFTKVGKGNFIGLRSGFFGYPDNKIITPDFCNFTTESRVSKSVPYMGTWSGGKLFSKDNSIELAL